MRKSFFGVMVAIVLAFVFIMVFCVQSAQAQDDKRGTAYFQLGRNSRIESSELDAKTNFGAGATYQLLEGRNFYLEPSFYMNWPQWDNFFYEGIRFDIKSLTYLFDFNGTVNLTRRERKVMPYITGGVGLLRNSASADDGYYIYDFGSDNHFTKNIGLGVRVFVGENLVAGFVWKNYWSGGGNFHNSSLYLGLRF